MIKVLFSYSKMAILDSGLGCSSPIHILGKWVQYTQLMGDFLSVLRIFHSLYLQMKGIWMCPQNTADLYWSPIPNRWFYPLMDRAYVEGENSTILPLRIKMQITSWTRDKMFSEMASLACIPTHTFQHYRSTEDRDGVRGKVAWEEGEREREKHTRED